jgi:hypothetical protein
MFWTVSSAPVLSSIWAVVIQRFIPLGFESTAGGSLSFLPFFL